MIRIEIPLRTVSPLNGSHGHWRVRHERSKREKEAVGWALFGKRPPSLPCIVTLTRIGPRPLDTDNLAASFKAVRDSVAVWLGLPTNRRGHAEDADPRVSWRYRQEKGGPGVYAVRIEAESAARAAGGGE